MIATDFQALKTLVETEVHGAPLSLSLYLSLSLFLFTSLSLSLSGVILLLLLAKTRQPVYSFARWRVCRINHV